jgi:hypothetical protein
MAKLENVFEVAKQSIIIAPKTVKVQAFIYKGVSDLENLVWFLGVTPKVLFEKGKMVYQFGKTIVPDNSIVMRNSFGEVTQVLNYADADKNYDLIAQREYDAAKDSQTPIAKPKKTRTPKK